MKIKTEQQMGQTALPGIRAIACVACSNLPRTMALEVIGGIKVAIMTDLTPLDVLDGATCTRETQLMSGLSGYIEETKLTFDSRDRLPLDQRLAFVVTDMDGRKWLIGSRTAPFPKIKAELTTGTPEGERRCIHYEITHRDLRSMVECIN